MESIKRFSVNNDWVTLILLAIIFMVVLANFIDQKRLRQLFALPYNNTYILHYAQPIWGFFNSLFFIISTLTLALYLFLATQKICPNLIAFTSNFYLKILGLIVLYWVFRYGIGKLIAYMFNLEKIQNQAVFLKMSYYYSASLYLLLFLVFSVYFFQFNLLFIYITAVFFLIFSIIRYVHFLAFFKTQISSNLFYFILYLCTLEIAPLLIAVKIGFFNPNI